MKKVVLLIVLILITGSIFYLTRPETIVDTSSGQTTTLGPLGERQPIKVGQQTQDFILTDYTEQQHKLSDYHGQPVVLNFWATWCPFCIEEMPLFNQVLPDYPDLKIIAINRGESLQQARSFTDPMSLDYTILLNTQDDVSRAYQVQAMPTTLFINPDGTIQSIKFGPIQESELRSKLDSLVKSGAPPAPVRHGGRGDVPLGVAEEGAGEMELKNSSRPITITKGVKHTIPLSDIHTGGPPKDGIPSIDNPKFTTVEEADEYLRDDGIGISVSFGGVDRFYPNQILVYHEIVNDIVDGQAALVTYCPLCGTGIVFEPIIDGEIVEFGTSGKLWNTNLIMYDRKTDTYWSQVLGEGVVGELAGKKLNLLPYDNITWKNWKQNYPKGEVLSRDTGSSRNYTRSPYTDYDTNNSIYFPVDHEDDRYHKKEPTFGIEIDGQFKVYPQSELRSGPSIFKDKLGQTALNIQFDKSNNTINITRSDNGKEVISIYGFWLSWFSVHPETEVYTAQ